MVKTKRRAAAGLPLQVTRSIANASSLLRVKSSEDEGSSKGFGRTLAFVAIGLTAWYLVTGQKQDTIKVEDRYPLPVEIRVVESSVPYSIDVSGHKIIKTKDIDFSKGKIDITTDRYHFVKNEDWWPIRIVGQTFSGLTKLYFWDHNVGWGADAKRTRALLAMVEDDKQIKGITVRVNRNAPFHDLYRLYTDPKVKARNNFVARWTIGTWDILKEEVIAGLFRGDYYNPLTQTAVVYSNVESIGAHEMGHHRDFQRFGRDWIYSISRVIPPVMLYQEWEASKNAKVIMSAQDRWQFNRYLLPAFFTYIYACWYGFKRFVKKMFED